MATSLTPRPAARRPSMAPILKEGPLYKRQRGQRSRTADSRKLRFQQRYACLTQTGLEYFDKKKGETKGKIPVDRIRIIEKVPDSTFQKSFCFQIGDEKDVMYFKTNTEKERKEWIESLGIAASVNRNAMLEYYHVGAYGQVDLQKWSCCDAADRDTQGCQETNLQRRMTSDSVQFSSRYSGDKTSHTFNPRHNTLATPSSIEKGPQLNKIRNLKGPGGVTSCVNRDHDNTRKDADSLRFDSASVDSGYLGGSQMSIISSQSGHAGGYTPRTIHKQMWSPRDSSSRKETIQEHDKETSAASPKVKKTSWECLDNSFKSGVSSVMFRGTDTLVAFFNNGSLHISDISVDDSSESILMINGGVGGFVDISKHYLAVGSSSLQLVNLHNTKTSRKILRKPNEESLPYLVAFTPEGQLLSYNQHQPNVIEVWPQMSDSSFDDVSSIVEVERKLEIEPNTCTVHGIAVSMNHHEPWLAVISNQVKIYDYSTQDFKHCINIDNKGKVSAAFSPTGTYIAISCGTWLKFNRIKPFSELSCSASFVNKELSITSLAYNTWPRDVHLAVGLSNGEIRVYNSLPDSPKCVTSLVQPDLISPVSCLAYSKDGFALAVGHNNGEVKIWKVPTALTNYNTNTGPSLVREGELQVDCKGKEYASPDDGYAFSIPPGSIPEGKTITFKHGIVSDGPFGPFEFPTDVRPVSSILSLHATIEQPLLKPIEIALPHIIHCENADDHKQLAVFKATCNDFRIGRNGEHIFSFKKVSSANLTIMMCQGFPYAKFSTCHCCYMCYGVCSKEDTDNALFCFVEAIPRVIRQSRPLIHFCVIFFLPTCLKAIKDQLEEDYDLRMQRIQFSSPSEAVISLDYQEKSGDWLFNLQGGNDKKIHREDVSFWEQFPSPSYLEYMCHEKLYPPRFTVCISGGRSNNDVMAEFKFPGAQAFPGGEDLVSKVYLPLDTQRASNSLPGHTSGDSRLNSTVGSESSVTTAASQLTQASPQIVQPAAEAFRACMCDLHSVHPAKLALNLFSKHVIEREELLSIQKSMKSPTKDDDVVVCTEILMKVYDALNTDDKLFSPVCAVLEKIDPDTAKKLENEKEKISKSGESSAESFPSFRTPQETLSNTTDNESVTDYHDADSMHGTTDNDAFNNSEPPADEPVGSPSSFGQPLQLPTSQNMLGMFSSLVDGPGHNSMEPGSEAEAKPVEEHVI